MAKAKKHAARASGDSDPGMVGPAKRAAQQSVGDDVGLAPNRSVSGGRASKKQRRQLVAAASAKPFATPTDIFTPDLMSIESRAALKVAYAGAEPYTHCVIRELCKPQMLAAVRQEIIANIQATYKETDLFKVFQTGDLGNLDLLDKALIEKLPTLMALKEALYSEQFRTFVREITGCGELADKTDCSCNVYAQGGHLLCHDDVIGTRRVSWIIYLTDPEDPWMAEDGGALELYPLEAEKRHTPVAHPTVCHLPTFNSMAMFTVLPGKSFHSVQEVLAPKKPRMSISGWFHAPVEPEGAAHASLQQLQAVQDGGLQAGADNFARAAYAPFTEVDDGLAALPAGDSGPLSEDDLAFLIRYVNPTYLSEAAWAKIQARFVEDGSVQLHHFLSKGLAERILAATTAADAAEHLGRGALPAYEAGLTGGWHAVGPPHKQRYLRYGDSMAGQPHTSAAGNAKDKRGSQDVCHAAGELLAQVRDRLFSSGPFQRLLRAFTTLTMVGAKGEVRRFRPGLDYTVAHYGILTRDPRLDVVLCFVSDGHSTAPPPPAVNGGSAAHGAGGESESGKKKKKGKKTGKADSGAPGAASHSATGAAAVDAGGASAGPSPWDDGEVGGFEAYLLADEDAQGAAAEEVYRQDAEDSGVLNLSASPNTLNLVLRDEGLMKFVKYVSAAAPGSRWDVAMEYLPEDDSDDEEAAAGALGEGQEEEEASGKRGAGERSSKAAETAPASGSRPGKGPSNGGNQASGGKKKSARSGQPQGSGKDAGGKGKRKPVAE